MKDSLARKIAKSVLPKVVVKKLRRFLDRCDPRVRLSRIAKYQRKEKTVHQWYIAYNNYGGYCLPLPFRHRPEAKKILLGAVHEPDTLTYMTSNCGEGDIVHAGTFFGDFLPALSKGCSREANVWAFEPHPESYKCAVVTILLNDLHNVILRNAGLAEETSQLDLTIARNDGTPLGGGSTLVPSGVDKGVQVRVETVRIDDIVPRDRRVSIIQLDVEGFEQQALTGGLETIRRNRPILILETPPSGPWFSNHLAPLGYTRTTRLHGNSVFRLK